VSYAQASQDLGVHTSQLRDWVKKFADDVGGTWIDGDGIAGGTAPCGCRRETDSVAGVRGLELANVRLIERRPNPLVCQNIFVPESFGEEPQRDGRGSHWGRARTRFPG
jgi:hypothetical protein